MKKRHWKEEHPELPLEEFGFLSLDQKPKTGSAEYTSHYKKLVNESNMLKMLPKPALKLAAALETIRPLETPSAKVRKTKTIRSKAKITKTGVNPSNSPKMKPVKNSPKIPVKAKVARRQVAKAKAGDKRPHDKSIPAKR